MKRFLRSLVATRRAQIISGAVVVVIIATTAGFALLGRADSKITANTHPRSTSTTVAPTTTRPRPKGVIAPLTGVRDLTGQATHRPALTIKIGNTREARPQKGLDQADVIYEEVVEGGATRLLAIFQSQVPDVVGPIRSVRRTDQGVVRPIGGIFVYSGGAPISVSSIRTAPVTLVDETHAGSAMFRDHSRSAPHNLFGRPAELFKFGGHPVPTPALFGYRPSQLSVPGTPVAGMTVGFDFPVSYEWDAARETWDRSIFGRADLLASGVQEAPRNVVVLLVHYDGGAGVEGSEAQLVGNGDAVVFTGGHRITASWSRDDPARPVSLRDQSGNVVRLTPGQTWVELAPIGTAVTTP